MFIRTKWPRSPSSIDAKEEAVESYGRYGFLRLPQGQRMFIPMEPIKKLIGGPA